MIHRQRRWHVVDVNGADSLADKLTDFTWTLCTGFRLRDVLFLNDSFCEDGAQEYAVVRAGLQIDSITFSWCTRDEAYDLVRGIVATPNSDYPGAGRAAHADPELDLPDPPSRHLCSLCA